MILRWAAASMALSGCEKNAESRKKLIRVEEFEQLCHASFSLLGGNPGPQRVCRTGLGSLRERPPRSNASLRDGPIWARLFNQRKSEKLSLFL